MSATHEHFLSSRSPLAPDGTPAKLHVIAVISNPARYASRYELYRKFSEHMKLQPSVVLHTCELAFGNRPFEIPEAELKLRSYDEIWHKENMINLMIQRLPSDWEYVAWIDADVEFTRKDWAVETIQQLQHYQIVQMFQNAIDLGPQGEFLSKANGFIWSYLTGQPRPKIGADGKSYGYTTWHSGYSWAARREAIDFLGGLYDVSILGSSDHLMAWGLVGKNILPSQMSEGYHRSLQNWIDRAEKFIVRDVGYCPGTLIHYFHGAKANRKYNSRWKILEQYKFDPDVDLKRDYQGVFQLDVDGSERMNGFRDALREYFRSRNEDGIDV